LKTDFFSCEKLVHWTFVFIRNSGGYQVLSAALILREWQGRGVEDD